MLSTAQKTEILGADPQLHHIYVHWCNVLVLAAVFVIGNGLPESWPFELIGGKENLIVSEKDLNLMTFSEYCLQTEADKQNENITDLPALYLHK